MFPRRQRNLTMSLSWTGCCQATSTALPSSKYYARRGTRTPILILSALSEVDDRIRGLRSGGDDYLTKPFAFGELLARLDALNRRAQGVNIDIPLTVGNLHMDPHDAQGHTGRTPNHLAAARI